MRGLELGKRRAEKVGRNARSSATGMCRAAIEERVWMREWSGKERWMKTDGIVEKIDREKERDE